MKLSTRSRYGLQAMYDLAMHAVNGPQPISVIAQREQIPEPFLEQLFATLRKKGLISGGDYRLDL